MLAKHLNLKLMLLAIPPLLGSLLVLQAGAVSQSLWILHLLAIGLAAVLALAGRFVFAQLKPQTLALTLISLTLLGLAIPLLGHSLSPERWLKIGSLNLYLAPLLLPAFLAAGAHYAQQGQKPLLTVLISSLGTGLILALQPDASQLLALLAGVIVLCWELKTAIAQKAGILISLLLLTVWAFLQPDPLQPVPYVEGVFALALSQSLLTGLLVSMSACLWLAGLVWSARQTPWLNMIAAYYLVLSGCSIAGLTPAPLLGYGAGPIIGFGLLAACSGSLQTRHAAVDHKIRAGRKSGF